MIWIIIGLLGSAIIGYLCGRGRGREVEGGILGLFLGPVGWLITLLLRPDLPPPLSRPGHYEDQVDAWERKRKMTPVR
jgi:hypothetical protein